MNSYKGLNSVEVEESRKANGSNVLTPAKRESKWKLFFCKFKDPLIEILMVAALLSILTGAAIESIGIIATIIIATFISFLNEYRAEKEFDILNTISDTVPVKVIRDGKVTEVKKTEVVVGDYVIVSTGDEIPADGKLLEAMDLQVNESSLNGESKPSSKFAEAVDSFDGAYSPNFIYRGTSVVEGDGVAVITAVGDTTEIGRTARQAAEITGTQTPLNKQLTRLGKFIGKIGIIVAAITFAVLFARDLAVGKLTLEFTSANLKLILEFFMVAVTLIVMAVPEGLPMSITLSLAYSMRKMTARNTLVRKMHACETMGAATVICTDKTGTLTQNKMKVYYCSSAANEEFATAVAINSTAFLEEKTEGGFKSLKVIGNPTEGALLMHLKEKGFDYSALRQESTELQRIPFNTQKKIMATVCTVNAGPIAGRNYLFVKGAPEYIVSMCNSASDFGRGLDPVLSLSEIGKYQEKGMRSLAFAHCVLTGDETKISIAELLEKKKLVYDGFASISDPVREDVPAAMRECLGAGIKVKIVTGDTSLTAIEIAKQSGLWTKNDTPEINCITGNDFSRLPDEIALQRAEQIKVMSRARPADKQRLVKLLQQQGEVVAVTGDGTNDAPALNYADVGLSMGSGTAVAKESSDIILLDDSFASVVSAVEWGRSIYINIQKFIYFQLTVNIAALLTAVTGPMIGIDFPLTVTQILWVNLIMDTFAAMALATEPARKEVMKDKPRKSDAFIINKQMMHGIIGCGAAFFILSTLLLVLEKMGNYSYSDELTNTQLSVFFTFFVFLQFWNMFNARALGSNHSAFYKISNNKPFIYIASIILLLQVLIVEFGGEVFRTVRLPLVVWICIIAITSIVLITGEIKRAVCRRNK